jgi:hypothetical protein
MHSGRAAGLAVGAVTITDPERRRAEQTGASQSDDDLSSDVSLFEVPDRLRDLTQRVGGTDDRRDLPGFNEFPENNQVFFAPRLKQRAQSLAHER